MPEKEIPTHVTGILPWLTTFGISVLATIAQYAEKIRSGEKFGWRNLALDAAICIFVGLVTHMICTASGVDGEWRSVIVAINAHMGTRAAMQWEKIRDRVLGLPTEDNTNGK